MTPRSTLLLLLGVALVAWVAAGLPLLPPGPSPWRAASLTGEPATGPAARFRDIELLPDGHGLAVANGARLWRTLDQGRSWTLMEPELRPPARSWAGWSLAVRGDGVGLLSTADGAIYRTEDRGESWSATRGPAPGQGIQDMTFVDEDTVVAVGVGVLLRSTDAGLTWTELPVPAYSYESVAFASPRLGLAVGGAGIVLRTTDAGATWEMRTLDVWALLQGVEFADPVTAVIVGSSGTILRSEDAGETWTRAPSGTRRHLFGLDFFGASHGLAVGMYGTILRTEDGGLTWREEPSGTRAHLRDVRFDEGGTATAVGWLERVLRDEGAGERRTASAISAPSAPGGRP